MVCQCQYDINDIRLDMTIDMTIDMTSNTSSMY